jgi:PAS domain S-box-containing protein
MPDSSQEPLLATDEYVIFSDEEEDELLFPAEEATPQVADAAAIRDQDRWKVMVVDDEPEIHDITALSLEDFSFEGKGLTFISAYSGEEATHLMEIHPDTALILLDVVMESDDAGLLAVKHIRQVIDNQLVRIVLRTGQPGQAPEETVIVDYDINDYKAKTELTTKKLFTTVVTALRAFRHVTTIETQRQENAALYVKLKDYSRTLAENERKYRTLFEDSRDAIYITTPAGQFVDINQAMLDLFGYERSKMLRLNAREVYANPADRAGFRQTIEQAGSVRDFELQFRKKDGTIMDCLLTATVRRHGAGHILEYQGIIRDITERKRQEEAERRLEIYRNSPQGRAETLAESLLPQPQTALIELYHLAQTAGQEPEAASLLGHLPKMLENLEAEQLAELAAGFNYLLSSQAAPELLPVGLRQLITQLKQPSAKSWSGAGPALEVYQLCQAALEVNSIAQIRQLLSHLGSGTRSHSTADPEDFLSALKHALAQLSPVTKTLQAYERVDTAQDKLAYLARTVERLGQVERLAQTELGGADRPVIYAISLSWRTPEPGPYNLPVSHPPGLAG